MKVAQLSGYISEHTSYHHGEVSLQGTIVNMAQDYVGSNNINLLVPSGQFGTRLMSGHDSGSPRYIFTRLQLVVKTLFNEHDNSLLDYLDDDGMSIEPKYYVPVIPMVLVNGAEGIGTGYSTNIPCYNPKDIVSNLRSLIDTNGEGELSPMTPWYRGFKGTIEKENDRFITKGVWNRMNLTTIQITELPLHKSTQSYKEFLETLVEANEIVDYKNNCDDTTIDFSIIMQKSILDGLSNDDVMKRFKLTSIINTSNMHVFDENCKIRKISCPEEVIFRFYKVRKQMYVKRRNYLLEKLSKSLTVLESKIKFIKLVMENRIVIFRKKKEEILSQLEKFKNLAKVDGSYEYLLEMKIHVFTEEKIKDLEALIKREKETLLELESTTVEMMWTKELNAI